ncbi:hypothetical protein [Paramaledivibacter caminithermalis]|jgi:rubrerythrin|uniref:Coat F domain-containing protein n=1 Tax=Paramaledivibacter caminithermalis (strain DSM 15212 / CIP 107654 / DViRD3) TaxID=1121301 RepID=A0A1M6P9K4_PARC5|nr:hypothetical protein [Paramaledivibacter caminithermalis]SHK04641.1 hypothetical protein SAMN02745912_02073 [Paramaledivibacter caminithermalis DSM 15212]
MKKPSQEQLMDIAFILSVDREELLLKKYSDYIKYISNKEIKNMIKEFKKTSKEHIKLIKDLTIKLNLQG